MQFAGICTVAFVNKGDDVAFRLEVLRQVFQQFLTVLVDIRLTSCVMSVFVNERADNCVFIFIQNRTQIGAAFRPAYLFFNIDKKALDLIVKFITVGDDDHAAVVNVLDDPFGEPYHYERFAGTLRVPDYAALAVLNALAGSDVRKILIMASNFFYTCVINHKVVYERKKPLLLAKRYHSVTQAVDLLDLQQFYFSRKIIGRFFILFPLEVVFFRRIDRAVEQALRFIAGEEELRRSEEVRDIFSLLILQKLTDTLTRAHIGTFQFKHSESDSVDVENYIGTLSCNLIKTQNRHFFSYEEVILADVIPIDVMDSLSMPVRVLRSLSAVTEQGVYAAVNLIERIGLVVDLAHKFADCSLDLVIGVSALF